MSNELTSGFYTLREAANLIALDVIGVTESALRRFFTPTQKYGPAVRSDRVSERGRIRDISFLDLMELRFIAHFRRQGVSAQALRTLAADMREELGPHPFAHKDIVFRTDLRKIYSEIAKKEGDKQLLELSSKQYMLDLIEDSLKQGVDWDARKYSKNWQPRALDFPEIVIDPRMSFGQPSLASKGVAIDTLWEAVEAEGGDYEAVAAWYGISRNELEQAIKFRQRLPLH
jgi:uncharacterized protein (DUF433 family)/DNA-binding transcriptional MerR regulator